MNAKRGESKGWNLLLLKKIQFHICTIYSKIQYINIFKESIINASIYAPILYIFKTYIQQKNHWQPYASYTVSSIGLEVDSKMPPTKKNNFHILPQTPLPSSQTGMNSSPPLLDLLGVGQSASFCWHGMFPCHCRLVLWQAYSTPGLAEGT